MTQYRIHWASFASHRPSDKSLDPLLFRLYSCSCPLGPSAFLLIVSGTIPFFDLVNTGQRELIVVHIIDILGQFQHQYATFTKGPTLNSNDTYKAEISLRGPLGEAHCAKVHLRRRKNMELQEHIACWHTAKNGTGLLSGVPEDYLVSRLYLKGQNSRSIRHKAVQNDVT